MDRHLQQAIKVAKEAQREGGLAAPEKPKRLPFKQLPLWPEKERAAPSAVLRSALFRAGTSSKQGSFKQALVYSWPGYEITYSGLEMFQADLDVWLQALHLAKQNESYEAYFSRRGFLRAMGRKGAGRSDIKWLTDKLENLGASWVTVKSSDEESVYSGGLLFDFASEGDKCFLSINPKLARLFDDGYTRLDWEDRLRLKGRLTKWLHGYICSHLATRGNPSKIGLRKLQKLCGSEAAVFRNFRLSVKRSMAQLEKHGVVMEWNIESDVLSFARPPRRRKLNSAQAT